MTDNRNHRRRSGIALSLMGILLNLLLFILKYTCGILSGSVAVIADGFNNLADTCSCIMTLTGFALGCKPPGKNYPMGYGRWEYLSGLPISAIILIIGVRMMISSVGKIADPKPVEGGAAVILILTVSLIVKGTMYLYNRHFGKKLNSSAMRAAALDSLCDCIATFAIMTSYLIERYCGFHADGYTGVLVALCILYAGISAAKDCFEPLLGKRIDNELEEKLRQIAAGYGDICDIKDILLHDYGPKSRLLTFTAVTDDPYPAITDLKKEITEQLHIRAIISPAPFKTSAERIICGDPAHNTTDERKSGA